MVKLAEQLNETFSPAELHEAEKTDIYTALTHPKMLSGLRSMARHARSVGTESGIAAYTGGSRISISKPLLVSHEEASRGDTVLPGADALMAGYSSFDADALIKERDPLTNRLRLRDDVVLLIHSHPLEGGPAGTLDMTQMLCPTPSDIEAYEQTAFKLPGLTEGILVTDGQQTDLLLYKRSPTRDYNQFYKAFFERPSRQRMLDSLQAGGLNIAELPLSRDPDFNSQVAQAVAQLYI